MSNKYVPSFIKKGISFEDTPSEKPLVNTSLPAREAPKLVPATLASLTSANSDSAPVTTSGMNRGDTNSKRSFANKFAAQQVNSEAGPNEKSIDCSSIDDFPSLGSSAAKPKNAVITPKSSLSTQPKVALSLPKIPQIRDESDPVSVKPTKGTWASMASAWAKQTEEEEAAKKEKELQDELNRKELEQLRKMMPTIKQKRRLRIQEDNDDGNSDADSFEVPEGEILASDSSDDENGREEFNQGIGWERRHHDDLY